MFLEYDFLVGIVLGLALGISVMILVSLNKNTNPKPMGDKLNIDNRISPFVEVHQSVPLEVVEEKNDASAEALRRKIEGFKNRNRFYH